MRSFISNFLYKSVFKEYLKDFRIHPESLEAKEIQKKIEKIIANRESRRESEILIVALSATAVKIKDEEKKEELIEEAIDWVCALSPTLAAMHIFRDFRALNFIGAKEVFKEKLEKYFS